MAENLIPPTPSRDLPLTRGGDLFVKVTQKSGGEVAPWDDGVSVTLTIGDTEWEFQASDGEIIVRVESEELDAVKKSTRYSMILNYPTTPAYNKPLVVGRVIRNDG